MKRPAPTSARGSVALSLGPQKQAMNMLSDISASKLGPLCDDITGHQVSEAGYFTSTDCPLSPRAFLEVGLSHLSSSAGLALRMQETHIEGVSFPIPSSG